MRPTVLIGIVKNAKKIADGKTGSPSKLESFREPGQPAALTNAGNVFLIHVSAAAAITHVQLADRTCRASSSSAGHHRGPRITRVAKTVEIRQKYQIFLE